ncbi:unnamed protein product [Didymodactylos carnosus]|uniref:Uncharacterized protein n=1 Tax=Didymodactylos carnosus TaxID=1234261 RepID=A0A814ZUM8_9BILA|nr:unnamed protein product [Didymodactylos carnosus]CAF1248618.1 unnamed protein product [Didymodactylos carnosus]CAF3809283.1 unnamed protein product [Didymodactylos carnosus]CAF4016469.1 unnamed protein product [Didymodactylos carnosus]
MKLHVKKYEKPNPTVVKQSKTPVVGLKNEINEDDNQEFKKWCRIRHDALQQLLLMRTKYFQGQSSKILGIADDLSSSDKHEQSQIKKKKRNFEWINILLPYLSEYNPYCSLCAKHKDYGSLKNTNVFTSYVISAIFYCQHDSYPFLCVIRVSLNGQLLIVTRSDKNNMNKDQPNRVMHTNQKCAPPIRRDAIKRDFKKGQTPPHNFDNTGKAIGTLKKIEAELLADSRYGKNEDESLKNVCAKWITNLSYDLTVKGAVQLLATAPSLMVIVYTEGTVRLYDLLIRQSGSVLSWDATGISQPSDNGKTIIHACVAHIMCFFRKRVVNKYVPEKLQELAMWCCSLLLNTYTWAEMLNNWRLVCSFFLNYYLDKILPTTYESLVDKIRHIRQRGITINDEKTSGKANEKEQQSITNNDPYAFVDDMDGNLMQNDEQEEYIAFFDEEKELDTVTSDLKKIFTVSMMMLKNRLYMNHYQSKNQQIMKKILSF